MTLCSTGKNLYQKVNLLLEAHGRRNEILIFFFSHTEKKRQFFSEPLLNLLEPDYRAANSSKQGVGLIDQIAFCHIAHV